MNGRPSGTCSWPSTDSRNQTLAKPSRRAPHEPVEHPLASSVGAAPLAVRRSPEQAHDVVDDLVDRPVGGVDLDRALGLGERAVLAALVERVAAGDVGGHRLVVEVARPRWPGGWPAPRGGRSGTPSARRRGTPRCRCRGPRSRPRRGSAAHSCWRRRSSVAHRGVGGHRAHRPGDLGAADLDRWRRRRRPRRLPSATVISSSGTSLATSSASVGSIPRRSAGERDRPVHGPGVEVVEPELLGQPTGDGRLARPGRPVDGDHPHRRGTLPTSDRLPQLIERVGSSRGRSCRPPRDRRSRCPGPRSPMSAKPIAMRWSS